MAAVPVTATADTTGAAAVPVTTDAAADTSSMLMSMLPLSSSFFHGQRARLPYTFRLFAAHLCGASRVGWRPVVPYRFIGGFTRVWRMMALASGLPHRFVSVALWRLGRMWAGRKHATVA